MSYIYKEGTPTGRSGISVRYSTDAPVFQAVNLDGRVAAVFNADSGPTDDVTIVTDLKKAKQLYGSGETTDILDKVFLGEATQVYAMRLPAVGALKGKAQLDVLEKQKEIQLTKGTEQDGTAVETAGVTFDFRDNQITVEFSNVPEGYKSSVRIKGQVGILAFTPGRMEDTELQSGNKHIISYYPGAAINGEMTVEAVLTKDTPTVLKSCTYTCAETYAEEPANVGKISLELKHEGARNVQLQIKQNLINEELMDLKLIEDGTEIENLQYSMADGQNQVENLITALNGSEYVDVTDKPETIENTYYIDQVASLDFTGGKDGEINIESYSKAFEILGKYRFASMVMDTVDEDIIMMATEFTQHCVENGRYFITCVGTEPDSTLEERLKLVKKIDNRNVAVVGPGYYDVDGNAVDGYMFAAQIGAMISAIPANRGITFKQITGAAKMIGSYTNDEYLLCNQTGLTTITLSDRDEIVIEKGLTSLQTLKEGIDDAGWKKIKRVKTRNSIMFQIGQYLTGYVGIPPTDDNKSFIKGQIGIVLDTFVSSKCISEDYTVESTDEIDEPNAFSYVIDLFDYDSGEEFYLHYIYHYKESDRTTN